MVEHTVVIDSIGGATIMTCEALQIKNVEYPYKEFNVEGVKNAILDYKYMTEKHADFDLVIVDNRPAEPENYNKKKEEESKIYKKDHNNMKAPKF